MLLQFRQTYDELTGLVKDYRELIIDGKREKTRFDYLFSRQLISLMDTLLERLFIVKELNNLNKVTPEEMRDCYRKWKSATAQISAMWQTQIA